MITACRQEKSHLDLLDLDIANITQLTVAQQAIFNEAVKRLDKHIEFDADAGQYVLEAGITADRIGLSQRLYDYFERNFEASNISIHEQVSKGYVAVEVYPNVLKLVDPGQRFGMFTKLLPEPGIEKGGINDIDFHWYGYDLYISNSMLKTMGYASGAIAIGSMWIPEPVVSKIISTITGGGAIALEVAADKYPNGVIVEVIGVPVFIKPQ